MPNENQAHPPRLHRRFRWPGAQQILSSAGMDILHHGAVEFITFGISSGYYAMGWVEQDLDDVRVISHSGNVPDYSAFMGFIPSQNKGLVLLFNADPYGMPPITEEVGLGALAVLAGQEPPPVKLDFMQWIMRLLPLIPLWQLFDVVASLRLSRSLASGRGWQAEPSQRSNTKGLFWRHIFLPLLPGLSLASLLGYLRSSGWLRFIQLFMPDLAWTVRISGAFALVWSVLRNCLLLLSARQPKGARKSKKGMIV